MKNEPKRLNDIGEGRRDTPLIDPRLIKIEKGHNPRNYNLPENRDHLDGLKANIREQGVLVPLLVRWDVGRKEAILVDGECRLTAVLELIKEGVGIERVPCLQVKAGNEQERLLLALTANTGKPLSKWEVGTAFQKLVKFGMAPESIATKLGFSVRYVNECIEMSDAPEEVKHLLSLEAVTPALALQHLRADGDKAGEVLKEKVRKAKSSAKPGAKKVTVKRERKQSGIKLNPETAELVIKALKSGQNCDHEKTAKLCAEALELIDALKTT